MGIEMKLKNKIESKCPGLATDIIIEYNNCTTKGIVLIERKYQPYGIAIPGGFVESGNSVEKNAIREAKEETGLDIEIKYLLGVYSEPDRDPRRHMVSVVYVASGSGILKAADDAKEAYVVPEKRLEEMIEKNSFAFDHAKIIGDYLKRKKGM